MVKKKIKVEKSKKKKKKIKFEAKYSKKSWISLEFYHFDLNYS